MIAVVSVRRWNLRLCSIDWPQLPQGMNPDALLDQPFAVPLQLSLPPVGGGRRLLVGEAGHRCHPVGGQGLNLCWRDVSDLLDLVAQQCRQQTSLSRLVRGYNRRGFLTLCSLLWAPMHCCACFPIASGLLLFFEVRLRMLQHLAVLRRLSLQAMSDGPMTIGRLSPQWGAGGGRHGVQQ